MGASSGNPRWWEGVTLYQVYVRSDKREIIGVSFWASQQLCEAWRSSESAAIAFFEAAQSTRKASGKFVDAEE